MSNLALAKALLLFGQFSSQHSERSVTDLSRATGLSKSNVSKILREFRAQGFLVQDQASRRYRVGPQALAVGAGYFAGSDLVRCADRVMQTLAKRTDATATLNVVYDSRMLFVNAKNGSKRPAFSWPVGSYIPLHATAAGKIAAAFAAPAQAKPMLADADLRSFTPSTICEAETLMQQLVEIRRVGIACTFGESTALPASPRPSSTARTRWWARSAFCCRSSTRAKAGKARSSPMRCVKPRATSAARSAPRAIPSTQRLRPAGKGMMVEGRFGHTHDHHASRINQSHASARRRSIKSLNASAGEREK
jgi:DNA-binding IclR family transcriptional regulator